VRADELRGPNRLLRGFLIISLGIHALVLAHIAGLYDSREMSYIELEMHAEEKPPGRSIPMPPQRHKTKPRLDSPAVKPMLSVPVEKPTVPSIAPLAAAVCPLAVEPIVSPERPDAAQSEPIAWSPGSSAPRFSGSPVLHSPTYGTAGDYFSMVRMKIERHKKYPYVARKRQIEGRVRLRFVIKPDGTVSAVELLERCRHSILNEAALKAVKESSPFPTPPKHLFSGPVTLEISIVFELT